MSHMQANASIGRELDVPAIVCAAISLGIAYAYTRAISWASDPDPGLGVYMQVARGLLQVTRVLMVATAVLLLLRALGVRIPSTVTRAVFTAGMLGVAVCYVMLRWDA